MSRMQLKTCVGRAEQKLRRQKPGSFGIASRIAPVVLLVLLAACSSAENRAAKERIFSPEEPPVHDILAQEKLDPTRAASDPVVWERLSSMSRLEALKRVGAHRSEAELGFRWKMGSKEIALEEEYRFEIDATGDFHASIMNDQDFGLEFIWASSSAYAKSRYGPYRPRRIDRGQQDRWREEGSGFLSVLSPLLDGRLGLKEAGQGEHHGRTALRFELTLQDKPRKSPSPELPPPVYGLVKVDGEDEMLPGPDPGTARRLAFSEKKEIRSISGELWVDQEAAVIVAVKLSADIEVPPQEDQEEGAELRLNYDWTLIPDPSLMVPPPEKAEPSHTVHGVDNPLWFLEGEPGFEIPKPQAEQEDEGASEE